MNEKESLAEKHGYRTCELIHTTWATQYTHRSSVVTERDGMTTVLTPDPHALKSQEPFSETSIGGKVTLVRMLLVEVTVVVFELVLISVIFCSCSKIWAVALRCDSFLL